MTPLRGAAAFSETPCHTSLWLQEFRGLLQFTYRTPRRPKEVEESVFKPLPAPGSPS